MTLASLLGACARGPHEARPCCTDLASCTAALRSVGPSSDAAAQSCASEASDRLGHLGNACAIVQELLSSASDHKRELGVRAVRGMSPPDRDCVVPALVAAYHGHGDFFLLDAMRNMRDARVASELTERLTDPNVREMSVLGSMGELAAPALPRLAAIAQSHWDGPTRSAAAEAYRALSGQSIEPGPYLCPEFV